jgi:hypothetical protein
MPHSLAGTPASIAPQDRRLPSGIVVGEASCVQETRFQYLSGIEQSRIDETVANLDAWFETMRSEAGYEGPVAHWWQQSLMYTGVGLDWRYEGIITGYLTLWERTEAELWLQRARRAGDDLVHGQRPDGHFRASGFEINPSTAGTPHEAACDIALLRLSKALKRTGSDCWIRFLDCARKNLEQFYIGQLWDHESGSFTDGTHGDTFVANKAATAAEAMFLLTEVTEDDRWATEFAIPTLYRVLRYQVRTDDELDGAIVQNSINGQTIMKYFPIYIARCIPALLRAHEVTGDEQFLETSIRAMSFIERWTSADGSIPTVIYHDKRSSSTPAWISPLGDVLRASDELESFGYRARMNEVASRLIDGQDETGGIQTARGFSAQAFGQQSTYPDARDLLHVVGWCDKAFRWLASHASPSVRTSGTSHEFEHGCVFRGRLYKMIETPEFLEFQGFGKSTYRWRKGEQAPEIASEEFWLR